MLGVIAVQSKNKWENPLKGATAAELIKNREAVAALAKSSDAQKLMSMLQKQGGVQEAAQAAAGGDARALMDMMGQLMNTKEGAELVERIGSQAKKAGLE